MMRRHKFIIDILLLAVLRLGSFAQARNQKRAPGLPPAPAPQADSMPSGPAQTVLPQVSLAQTAPTQTGSTHTSPSAGSNPPANSQAPTAPPGTPTLTLQ